MRRALLAGCVTAAAGLHCGCAGAQARFDVKVGGDAYFEAGYIAQRNDSGLRSTEFRNRFRLNIVAGAKADNGLEYGARLRMRANTGDRVTDADRVYLFAQGAFGQLRLGLADSFDDDANFIALGIGRPRDFLPIAIMDQATGFMGPAGAGQGVDPATGRYTGADVRGGISGTVQAPFSGLWPALVSDNNGSKIGYSSPRYVGFQVGGSFTPRNDSANTDVNRVRPGGTAGAQASGLFQDLIEVGANYADTIGGVKWLASFDYMRGTAMQPGNGLDHFENLGAWHAAARAEYAGFSVGGGYTSFGRSGQNTRYAFTGNAGNWEAGAQYRMGPWVFGVGYMHGTDPGSTTLPNDRKTNVYEAGIGYTVAPGLLLQAQYDHFTADSDKATTAASGSPDDRGNIVLARTVLVF